MAAAFTWQETMARILPHWNASLNALATVLLVVAYVLIQQRRERAHRNVMLAAFGVSTAFLASYLVYHLWAKAGVSTPFPSYPPIAVRYAYYGVLLSHIVLAIFVPVLALLAIYWAYRDDRARHRRVAKWAFPIWLYVSVTGVVVYLMLYQIYPPASG